jgi:hypothetical protein
MRFTKTQNTKKPLVVEAENRNKFTNNDKNEKFNFDIVSAQK